MTIKAEIRCPDADATRSLGAMIAQRLFAGAVVLLEGPIGVGKTCIAQAIAHSLGVVGPVPSPTFILIAEYPDARIPLFHGDFYRLKHPDDLYVLDIPGRLHLGVWLIEWADRFPDLWPDDHLHVHLRPVPGDPDAREVTLTATGPIHAAILDGLAPQGAP